MYMTLISNKQTHQPHYLFLLSDNKYTVFLPYALSGKNKK